MKINVDCFDKEKTENKIFDNCVHYRENQTHCKKHFYIYDCRGCKFYKTNPIFDKIAKLDKRITNLEKVYLMMYDEFDKKLEMLRENNNLFANEIKKVGGFEEEEDDFESLDLSPVKELLENKKEDDKNEQLIQDIQKRILLKHFIKHWHADDMDYCDYSTKKCTHDSCLDHYLEYYIENKLWEKVV